MKINPFIGHERPPKYMGPNSWEPKFIKGWAITLGVTNSKRKQNKLMHCK
jgi:hypothetical protein